MNSRVSVAAVVVGLIFLGLCVAWTQYLDRNAYWWSDSQAQEYTDAGNELHRLSLSHTRGHVAQGDDGSEDDPLTAARARFDQIQNERLGAIRWRRKPALVLKWAGIFLIVLGVTGLFTSESPF